MTHSDAEKLCGRWLPAWTGNVPEALAQFYTEDAFYRDPANPEGLRGRPALLVYFRKLLARNPEWRWSVLEILPTERGFALKWAAIIPTASRTLREVGLDIVELRGEQICRNEVYFDTAALLGGR